MCHFVSALVTMKVNDETIQKRVSGSRDTFLDLGDSELHFAGVPPGMDPAK